MVLPKEIENVILSYIDDPLKTVRFELHERFKYGTRRAKKIEWAIPVRRAIVIDGAKTQAGIRVEIFICFTDLDTFRFVARNSFPYEYCRIDLIFASHRLFSL